MKGGWRPAKGDWRWERGVSSIVVLWSERCLDQVESVVCYSRERSPVNSVAWRGVNPVASSWYCALQCSAVLCLGSFCNCNASSADTVLSVPDGV